MCVDLNHACFVTDQMKITTQGCVLYTMEVTGGGMLGHGAVGDGLELLEAVGGA